MDWMSNTERYRKTLHISLIWYYRILKHRFEFAMKSRGKFGLLFIQSDCQVEMFFLAMFSFICKFYCSIYQSLALTKFCQGVHNLQFKWHTSIKTNRWIICYTIYTCGNLSAQTANLLNWEYKSQDFGSVSRHSV